jgi:hypothetical protein
MQMRTPTYLVNPSTGTRYGHDLGIRFCADMGLEPQGKRQRWMVQESGRFPYPNDQQDKPISLQVFQAGAFQARVVWMPESAVSRGKVRPGGSLEFFWWRS